MTGMPLVKQAPKTAWIAVSSFFKVATCFLSALNSARVGPACWPPTAVVTYKSAAPARAATSSANPFILPPRSRDDDPTRQHWQPGRTTARGLDLQFQTLTSR